MRIHKICLAVLSVWATTAMASADQRPNVVFLLSDNLGYGDLGSYGGGEVRGMPTPHLDALASEGMRFTNFNVEAECTPSRAALMTGRYAVRTGATRAALPGLPQGLAPWEYTMAEVFKDAGYDTAMFGKWHIGDSEGRFPTDQGFDQWWGFPHSTDVVNFSVSVGFEPDRLPPFHIYEGTAKGGAKPVESYVMERRSTIDATITERSVDFINQQAKSDKPFFLYVPFSLVHHPSLPHPDFEGKTGNGPYADAVVEHDYRVGEILDALKANGLEDNTLIVYASDNGPDRAEYPEIGSSGPYRGYLGTMYEGSIRTPMFIRWPGEVPAGKVTNEIVSIHDFVPSFAELVGIELPDDRAYDGKNQMPLFLNETDKSAKELVMFFHHRTLVATKWKQFKVFMQHESADPKTTNYQELWAPLVYDVAVDPQEQNNITHDGYLWIFAPMFQEMLPFTYSVDKYGLIPTGGDEPEEGEIIVPGIEKKMIDESLSALKKQFIIQKVKQFFGIEDES